MPYIELLRKLELYWIATRTMLDSGIDSLMRATNVINVLFLEIYTI